MKRWKFTREFKLRVVLEAMRGDETVRSIAVWHGVNRNQVSKWKTEAHGVLLEVFARGGNNAGDRGTERLFERLYAGIGELTVERDFFEGFGALRRSERARLIREDDTGS